MLVLGKNVVVKASEEPTQSDGSRHILPPSIYAAHKKATVVAVGMDCNPILQSACVVYLNWKEALPIEHNGVQLAIVDEAHIKIIIQ